MTRRPPVPGTNRSRRPTSSAMGARAHPSLVWSALATVTIIVAAACAGDGGGDLALSAEAEQGREIYNSNGCAGCHGRGADGGVGPSLVGLPGSERELVDGTTLVADREYLIRSIADPAADIVAGYNLRMPSNQLSDADIELVIAYIEELEPSS